MNTRDEKRKVRRFKIFWFSKFKHSFGKCRNGFQSD